MSIRSAGLSAARFFAPLFSSRIAQSGISNAVRFLEALQGIGTGAQFNRRELNCVFKQLTTLAPVVFDAGAHSGDFLQEAINRTANDASFHVFEPANASFRELSARFRDRPGIHLNRSALSRYSGTGVLFYPAPDSQLASLTPRPSFGQTKSESVRLETLDEYCSANNVQQIDLLKLDVEGHELEVLQGATDLLKRQAVRIILFEFGGCNIDMRVFFRDLYDFLTERNMRISRLMPSGNLLSIGQYDESVERFRTTNYLAIL